MRPFNSGYACASEGYGYFYYCTSCATSNQVVTVTDVGGCERDSHGDPVTRLVSTTVNSASACGGYIPQVVYIRQSSAPLTTNTNTTTTTSAQAGPPSSTTTSSSSSSSSSSSLSAGAKAGIAVAVALVVILLLTGLLILYKRRQRSRIGTRPEPEARDAHGKPELASEEKARSELAGNNAQISELSNETQTPGSSRATVVAELDGGEVIRPLAPKQTGTL